MDLDRFRREAIQKIGNALHPDTKNVFNETRNGLGAHEDGNLMSGMQSEVVGKTQGAFRNNLTFSFIELVVNPGLPGAL